MIELGGDAARIASWFIRRQESSYVLIRLSPEHAAALASDLGDVIRRCYIPDDHLHARAVELASGSGATAEQHQAEIVDVTLPPNGSTMAGDFVGIRAFLILGTSQFPPALLGAKKWRLKQDASKPAPGSDVIQFHLPTWPTPSSNDAILCAEVKTKSTTRNSSPIADAIADCIKDRTSRLAKTLQWLKARALAQDLGMVTLALLNRFIRADEFPRAVKLFHAVVVLCASLTDSELQSAPESPPDGCSLVIVSVPELQSTYQSAFATARGSRATEAVRG